MGALPQQLTLENFHDHYRSLARVALAAAQKAFVRPDLFPDAEEAASDAMLALVKHLWAGKPIRNPAAFVTRIAQRRATDGVRSHQRDQELVRDLIANGVLDSGSDDPQPGEQPPPRVRRITVPDLADVPMLAERLRLARQRMSEQQRRCFEWHDLGLLSEQKVAQLLGIKVGTVRVHLHRAREILAEEFEEFM